MSKSLWGQKREKSLQEEESAYAKDRSMQKKPNCTKTYAGLSNLRLMGQMWPNANL